MTNSMRTAKRIPEFRSEAQERRFWETHDSVDYIDWSSAVPMRFPNLKPTTETISLRLPTGLLADLKALANKRDVPYQSLLKVFLADRVAREWQSSASSRTTRDARAAARGMSKAQRKPRSRPAHG